MTLLLPLGWRCLPFGAAKISFFTGFPQASFIHRQKRRSEKHQPYRNTRHLQNPRAASVGPAVPFLPFGKRESSGRAAPPWNAGKSVLLPLLPFPPPNPQNRPWYPETVSRAQYIYNERKEKFHFISKKVVPMLVKRPKPMYLCNRKQGGTLLKRVPLGFAPRKGRVL